MPVLQGNLNHTPLQSLGGHSPVELFTGLPTSSQLDAVVGRRNDADFVREINLEVVDEQLDALRRSLHGMHKDVVGEKERRRLQDMAAHKGSVVNFAIGDYRIRELNQTEELLELVSREEMVLGVEDIRDHRFNAALDRWEIFYVSWMGPQAIEDSWEPLAVLAQDVPAMVREYNNASDDDDLRSRLNNAPRIIEL
ncbi:unnamed protein product [Phytophthora fragariaefolia]|uniref:Unnamed protein product n=1 Tax=Phytophthora fragariaefolia TaxID=1490495 RepID=A0A9W6WR62_9STRA|nr:unnamed protein product [Phytophthora fragariaefolia]